MTKEQKEALECYRRARTAFKRGDITETDLNAVKIRAIKAGVTAEKLEEVKKAVDKDLAIQA